MIIIQAQHDPDRPGIVDVPEVNVFPMGNDRGRGDRGLDMRGLLYIRNFRVNVDEVRLGYRRTGGGGAPAHFLDSSTVGIDVIDVVFLSVHRAEEAEGNEQS